MLQCQNSISPVGIYSVSGRKSVPNPDTWYMMPYQNIDNISFAQQIGRQAERWETEATATKKWIFGKTKTKNITLLNTYWFNMHYFMRNLGWEWRNEGNTKMEYPLYLGCHRKVDSIASNATENCLNLDKWIIFLLLVVIVMVMVVVLTLAREKALRKHEPSK